MMAVKNKVLRYLIIAMVAALAALNYEIFVFPNNFAPAGLNGFLTIIRHLTGFTFGYMSLLMNIPLLVIAFKVLKRHYAIKTFIYVVSFSVASVLLKNIDISAFGNLSANLGEITTCCSIEEFTICLIH